MNLSRWLTRVKDLMGSSRLGVTTPGKKTTSIAPLGFELLEDRIVPQAGSFSENFISQVYTDLLDRAADSGGLSFWSGQIDGGESMDAVVLSIEQSPEYRNDLVGQIYETYLHRPVDPGSLGFWGGQLGDESVEAVEASIIGSTEFWNDAGANNSGFLEALYQDALGRAVDPSGAATYGGLLDSGASRISIAYDILTSTEYRTDLVESYYQQFLHRPADPAGLSFWVEQLADGNTDQGVVAGILTSVEYVGRIPGAPTITSPTSALTTAATSFTITGSAENGSFVQVYDSSDGAVVGSEQLIGAETNFSITVPLTSSTANNFYVTDTNSFGKQSAETPVPTITQSSDTVTVTKPSEQMDDEGTTITPLTVTATDADSKSLSYSATGLPSGLSIASATGVISGTIATGTSTDSPYTVTVTATNTVGATGSATFTWLVDVANGITLTNPGSQSDIEGATVSLPITATEDNKNPLTYSATDLPNGLTIDSATGKITGTVGAADATSSPYSVTVSATDGLNTGTTSFTWTITPAIVVTNPGDQTSTESNSVSLSLTATDHYSKTLTYSATGLPSGLSIAAATGAISGTIAVGDHSSSPYTVTASATDGTYTGTTTFTWTVNSTITVSNPGPQSGVEGDSVTLSITASDTVSGATLTYSETGLPGGLSIDSADGTITGTILPGDHTSSPYSVTVSATDGTYTGSTTFAWTVTSPVTVDNPGPQTGVEGGPSSLTITGSDSIAGATLSYSSTTLPDGLSIDPDSGAITGTFSPGDATSSPYSVTVTASDGTYFGSTTFTWTVSPAITVTGPGDLTNVEGASVDVTVSASDIYSGSLTYSATGLPTGLTIDSSSGTIGGSLAAGDATHSPYTVTASATDGTYTGTTTFTWTVDSPVAVASVGSQSDTEGTTITPITVSATDAYGLSLSFSATGLPSDLTIAQATSTTAVISGTIAPGANSASPYTVTISASDGTYTAGTTQFTWTVNSPISITNPGAQSSQSNTPVSVQIEAADSASLSLTYSAIGLPSGLTITPTTDTTTGVVGGAIGGTPAPSDVTGSPYSVTVTAADGIYTSQSVTFSWTITPSMTVTSVAQQVYHSGTAITPVTVSASDTTTNAYSYSATGLPSGLSIDGTTGVISGTIASSADTSSPYTATITVTDPTNGLSGVTNISWLVYKSTDPLLQPPATQLNIDGDTVSGVTVTAAAANSSSITYSATGLPSGLSINSSTGAISGTLPASSSSSPASTDSPYTVTVTAKEGSASSTATFSWVVTQDASVSALPASLTDPAWVTLPSGVRYLDLTVGTGTEATSSSSITADYAGYLTDGTLFQAGSLPSTSLASGLIPGWLDGIPGMKVGGVRLLDIPSALAYGTSGQGNIPPNAELVFVIALTGVS